jgi:hypothetical protein
VSFDPRSDRAPQDHLSAWGGLDGDVLGIDDGKFILRRLGAVGAVEGDHPDSVQRQ